MENHYSSWFDELSLGELINGIILFMNDQKFNEQQLYRFFDNLSSEDPILARRLRFRGIHGKLQSEPLRQILTFREMGKSLEIHMPNPVDQTYSTRASQRESIRRNMENNNVLPKYEDLLKELAQKFLTSLIPA